MKLSVANVASAASVGSKGVSRAITSKPALRACSSAGTTVESDAVINIPLAPAEVQFSIAAICVSTSPSTLPANDISSIPSSVALASAPSFIFTKNGLELVLVIKHALSAAAAGALANAVANKVPATAIFNE